MLKASIFCYNGCTMEKIECIREFNRAYTAYLGVLNDTYLDSGLTLTEIRVLFEVWNDKGCSANRIRKTLRLNEGYISRVIKKLEKTGSLVKVRSDTDRRAYRLFLTEEGKRLAEDLSERAKAQVADLLRSVDEENKTRLINAMAEIREILKI